MPGVLHPEKSPGAVDAASALETFRVNVLGPLLLLKHFSAFLPKKKKRKGKEEEEGKGGGGGATDADPLRGLAPHATVALMSARVGSISDNALGGWYSYRASKAAVNQLVKTFDNHLKSASGEGAICVGVHPGTVKTALSRDFWGSVKEGKLFTKEFSAERLCDVVARLRADEGRGRCWDWKGEEVPP